MPPGATRSTAPNPRGHNIPDIVAVEAVDEDVPTEVEEVDGRRRHRHRRPRPERLAPPLSRRRFHRAPLGVTRAPVICRGPPGARRTVRRARGLVRSRGSTSTKSSSSPGSFRCVQFFRIDLSRWRICLVASGRDLELGPRSFNFQFQLALRSSTGYFPSKNETLPTEKSLGHYYKEKTKMSSRSTQEMNFRLKFQKY